METFRRCRIGAPSDALKVVGIWARAHADLQPEFAVDFYQANRRIYRKLARHVVWQYREHLDQLEEKYLVMPDGSCALPVAYTLSYGYWVEKRINAWIDILDARLDNDQLDGDQRVSWLLARAQAEEIRRSPGGRFLMSRERSLAGLGWIQEATMVAESEPARLRVYQEMAARFSVDERLDAAGAMLDKAATRCTSGPSVKLLAKWRAELGELSQAFQVRHEAQETFAQQAYADRLKRRHQTALDRGDSQAVMRYEQLLTKAGAANDQHKSRSEALQ